MLYSTYVRLYHVCLSLQVDYMPNGTRGPRGDGRPRAAPRNSGNTQNRGSGYPLRSVTLQLRYSGYEIMGKIIEFRFWKALAQIYRLVRKMITLLFLLYVANV